MNGAARVLTYPAKGAIVVTVTRPLFGGELVGPKGKWLDGEPPTHFTSMLPGTFASEQEAQGFIARVHDWHGGEMRVERVS